MNYRIFVILIILTEIGVTPAMGQYFLKSSDWEVQISENGKIGYYRTIFLDGNRDIAFRNDKYSGPAFKGVNISLENEKQLLFSGEKDNLKYSLQYKVDSGNLVVVASIENTGKSKFRSEYERLIFGLNTYMEKYPDCKFR